MKSVRPIVSLFLFSFFLTCIEKQAFAFTKFLNDEASPVAFKENTVVPIAIIGSGPAGLAAALYVARHKIHTVVLTGSEPGGRFVGAKLVENLPAIEPQPGYQIMDTLENQARKFGASILYDGLKKIDVADVDGDRYFVLETERGKTIHALSVILATGAAPARLHIPGEDRLFGKSVFICAKCDCGQAKDKDIVIVGGGDGAVSEAIMLSAYARKVTILVRKNRMRAVPVMRDRLDDYDAINVVYNKEVLEVLGDDEVMTGLRIRDVETGDEEHMDAECLFLALGREPDSRLFAHLLDTDKKGYILTRGCSQKTSCPGIFAAGEVHDKIYRQAQDAMSFGGRAGYDVIHYLQKKGFSPAVERALKPFYFTVNE